MTTTPPLPRIALVDHTGKFSTAEIGAVSDALNVQVQRDFSLPPPWGWGLAAAVRATPYPLPHEWVLGIFTDPDQPGALGYHDETPNGLPLAKIFPFLELDQPWSVTASHELLEMLADPMICRAAQSRDGKFWALEVCDAVEQDTYMIDQVVVSDFVTPPYFEPPSKLTGLKLDHMGLVKKPYEILPGGYGQWFDPSAGWQMVQADRRSAYRSSIPGRSALRQKIWQQGQNKKDG